MLPNPIVVSDEEIKDGDSLYYASTNVVFRNYMSETPRRKDDYKIIAGIPELPTIDFSALSEEECKNIGWVDVKKLAYNHRRKYQDSFDGMNECIMNDAIHQQKGFIEGFKAAQSLNEKNFSEEDLIKAIELACEEGMLIQRTLNDKVKLPFNRIIEYRKNYIQSLSQPKVFDIEVEMGSMRLNSDGEEIGFPDMTQPKITNNSIKILKVL